MIINNVIATFFLVTSTLNQNTGKYKPDSVITAKGSTIRQLTPDLNPKKDAIINQNNTGIMYPSN